MNISIGKIFTKHILLLLLLLPLSACRKEKISFATSFTLNAPSSGYEYEIKVVKAGGSGEENVFFVLDSKAFMPIVQTQIEKINPTKSITFIGIYYTDGNKRERDYTISLTSKGTGEAAQFLSFITDHLDSALLAKNVYTQNAKRGIIGHSLGGLFGAYSFSKANSFFSNYLILSPALFYDDYACFKVEEEHRSTNTGSTARMYLGVGAYEDWGMNNSYAAFKNLITDNYPTVDLQAAIVKGSHYNSRDENMLNGLQHLLK